MFSQFVWSSLPLAHQLCSSVFFAIFVAQIWAGPSAQRAAPQETMPIEWTHAGHVSLIDFGPEEPQRLRHSVTGEVVVLEGRWSLDFEGTLGFVSPVPDDDESEPRCVNHILELSVQSPGDGEGSGPSFIWDRVAGTSTVLEDHEQQVATEAFVVECNLGKLRCELYRHSKPKTDLLCARFFVAPWVQAFLLGSDGGSKWASQNIGRWLNLLGSVWRCSPQKVDPTSKA